jgi:fructokinase
MRKVIGIGETILDIIFENGQPQRAVVGGSVLNGLVSLARLGVEVTFISELGDDRVGDMVCDFLADNGMTTDFIHRFEERKSPVSLAFLGADRSADYVFHTDYPPERLLMPFPEINEDDVFVFGSFYALDPDYRSRFLEFVKEAERCKALIYYDPNFRPSHKRGDMRLLRDTVAENFRYSSVVRGSNEDFFHLFGGSDMQTVYDGVVSRHCRYFLTTHGSDGVNLFTDRLATHFDATPIKPLSTVGAGDNFNAGVVYGLLKYGVRRRDIPDLNRDDWERIVRCGIDLSSEVCLSYDNYISPEFASKYKTI